MKKNQWGSWTGDVNDCLPKRQPQVEYLLDQIDLDTSNNQLISSSQFKKKLDSLRSLQDKIKTEEQNFYKKAHVNGIVQLNQKILSTRGLRGLAGANLNNNLTKKIIEKPEQSDMNILQSILDSQEATVGVADIVEDAIKNDRDYIYEVIDKIIDNLNQMSGENNQRLNKSINRELNTGISKLLKNIKWDKKLNKLVINDLKSNTKLNSDIRIKVKNIVPVGDSGILIEIDNQNREIYAGWNYNWKDISNNTDLQNTIRQNILETCENIIKDYGASDQNLQKELNSFETSFNAYPTPSLLQNSKAGIMGAIGEITQGAYICYLLDINTLPGSAHTGQMLNTTDENKGGQLAIDFLLENFGIQVKNYNECASYLSKELQEFGTITLHRSDSLGWWSKKFDLQPMLEKMLQIFYGVYHFNIPYDPSTLNAVDINNEFEPTRKRIDLIEQRMNQFFLAFPDKYLRISEDIESRSTFDENTLKGLYYNTFFFVSGRNPFDNRESTFGYIPSSAIIQDILNFFEDLDQTTNYTADGVNVKSSYKGENITKFIGENENKETPLFSSMSQAVSLTFYVKMKLEKYFKGDIAKYIS